MEYKYTGIVLNKKDVGETDRIYAIYTLEQGKIRVMARGVRKIKSKLAGNLENFYLIDLSVMKNRGLGNIAGAIVENNFKYLHQDFNILEKVFQVSLIFDRLIAESEADEKLFNVLFSFLETMDTCASGKISELEKINQSELIKQCFLFKFLERLGYRVELSKCVSCENKLTNSKNYFSYEKGGIVCQGCVKKSQNIMPISNNAIKIIRIFFQNKLSSIIKLKVSTREVNELSRISQNFIKWIC